MPPAPPRRASALPLALALALPLGGCGGAEPTPREPAATADVTPAPEPDRPATPAAPPPAADPVPTPAPVVRPPDRRPPLKSAALDAAGLHRSDGEHVTVVTDLPRGDLADLSGLIDAAHAAWVDYFGPLPPDARGAAFASTGYVMGEPDRFRAAGLLPDDLPPFLNGRQRGREWWLYAPHEPYFLRSLAVHEATHAYMTALPGTVGPLWYMEGMAELFGTHTPAGTGPENGGGPRFRIIPADADAAPGWGRIEQVRAEVAAGGPRSSGVRSLADIRRLGEHDFLNDPSYAWAWAACAFLDGHPRWGPRFRELGDPSLRRSFDAAFDRAFAPDAADLLAEWPVFAGNLCHGFDRRAAAIAFRPGTPLSAGESRESTIAADRGWQSTGVYVREGERVRVAAEGRFTLADDPVPWESTAAGITFTYAAGRPLGELHAAVRADPTAPGFADDFARQCSLLETTPVGGAADPGGTVYTAPFTGTVYLRVNDRWDGPADNRGALRVTVSAP